MSTLEPKSIIEIIYKSSTLVFDDQAAAEDILHTLVAHIRLDYHGVLDILPYDMPILTETRKHNTICAISFVGRFSETRDSVRKDLMKRIGTKQIDFGILLFARGRGKHRHRYTDVGSKAWVNKHVSCDVPQPCLFLDDTPEHIRSTTFLVGSETIHAELFNSGTQKTLLEKIKDYSV